MRYTPNVFFLFIFVSFGEFSASYECTQKLLHDFYCMNVNVCATQAVYDQFDFENFLNWRC